MKKGNGKREQKKKFSAVGKAAPRIEGQRKSFRRSALHSG